MGNSVGCRPSGEDHFLISTSHKNRTTIPRRLVSSIFNVLTFPACFSFMCVVGCFVASWGNRVKPRNCFNQAGMLNFVTQKAVN